MSGGKKRKDHTDGVNTLGPAMSALSEKQRAFVLALRDIPDHRGRQKEAARRAGYAGDANSLGVTGHRLAHDPKIQAAVKEVALGMMSSEGIGLIAELLKIAYGDTPATATERMKAISMVLNRTGMPEKTEASVTVTHTIDNDEYVQRLTHYSKVLGLDPQMLLGRMGIELIEGEFREVQTAEARSAAPGVSGVPALLCDSRHTDDADDTGDDGYDEKARYELNGDTSEPLGDDPFAVGDDE